MTLVQFPVSIGAEPFWEYNRYVRPVVTRRHGGLALEVNLTPGGACNLNCLYCSVHRNNGNALVAVELDLLAEELDPLVAACASGDIFGYIPFKDTPDHLRNFEHLAFSGTGEPTASPFFAEAATIISSTLASHGLFDHPVVVQTNASLLHRRVIANALRELERHDSEIWCKLDAGSEQLFNRIVRTPVPMARVLTNIAQAGRRRPVVIESMFVALRGHGLDEEEIQQYLERLNDLVMVGCHIRAVHVSTISRPAVEHGVAPLSEETVDRIAGRICGAGFEVAAYYESD